MIFCKCAIFYSDLLINSLNTKIRMGISVEQYRAAIGNWNARHSKRIEKDNTTTNEEEAEIPPKEKVSLKGPWKVYTLILVLMFITAGLLASPVPSNPHAAVSTLNPETIGTKASTTYPMCLNTTDGQTISKQCLLKLLMIGGVEQNPGPTALEKQDNIIAELASSTDDTAVRDTIRLYDARMDTKTLERHINNGAQKDKVVLTLAHLGVPDMQKYNKGTCVFELVCRIQNLFPDTCRQCKEEYCIKLGDTPLLACDICGQGSHDPCILQHLQVPDDERSSFTSEDAWKSLNPTELPGLHYMCVACEGTTIPSKNDGLLKSEKKSVAQDESTDTPLDTGTRPDDSEVFPDTSNGGRDNSTAASSSLDTSTHHVPDQQILQSTTDGSGAQSTLPPPNLQTPVIAENIQSLQGPLQPAAEPEVCPFYIKGTCRFGIAGRQCPKMHPPACKKLLRHGNRGPRGCTAGRNCDKFHPPTCQASLKKRECFNTDCKLVHVAGTKRIKPVTKERPHATPNPQDQSPATPAQGSQHTERNQDCFLEAMRTMQNFQIEIMREIHRLSVVRPPPGPFLPQQLQQPPMGINQSLPPTTSSVNPIYAWPNSGTGQYLPGVVHGNPMMMGPMPLTR